MRIPDFFIVGAPKSGTTALREFLYQHPEIFMPDRTELHFFGSDLVEKCNRPHRLEVDDPEPSLEEYLSYFRGAHSTQVTGEKSVFLLFSETAAEEIRDANPEARIIVMLRNPVDVMLSLHHHQLYNRVEHIQDFRAALDAEANRRNGELISEQSRSTSGIGTLFYRDVVRYPEQLRKYLDVFGRDSVHIIIFDDFKVDNPGVYQQVCSFLGVSQDFEPRFRTENPSKHVRSERVQNVLVAGPPGLRRAWRKVVPKPLREVVGSTLKAMNSRKGRRATVSSREREDLLQEFTDTILQTEEIVGRKLEPWLRTGSDV